MSESGGNYHVKMRNFIKNYFISEKCLRYIYVCANTHISYNMNIYVLAMAGCDVSKKKCVNTLTAAAAAAAATLFT